MFEDRPWSDYAGLGITAGQIPALLDILDEIDAYVDSTDPLSPDWIPIHAWRALAELDANAAIGPLLALLARIDEEDDEVVQIDLPRVFNKMGEPCVPALIAYLNNKNNFPWARLTAAESLTLLAESHPHLRDQIIASLSAALAGYAEQKKYFNGFLIDFLARLQAVEAVELARQVFQAEMLDEEICGDWPTFLAQITGAAPPADARAELAGVLEQAPSPAPDAGPHKAPKKANKHNKHALKTASAPKRGKKKNR